MQISQIRARNVLGARDIHVVIQSPVSLFCGFNGAGKSSIQESIRLAFQGETLRVTHKKDYPLMVSDGAKEGFVKLIADGQVYEYKLPAGEHIRPESSATADQLNSVLNAQRFASLTADERRAFLTILTKAKPSVEKLRMLLAEAGVEAHRMDLAIPMLKSGPNKEGGFPAACLIAKDKATEAKGAWKIITGGNWGSLKGETWAAPEAVEPDEAELAAAAELVEVKASALASGQQMLGGLAEKIKAAAKRVGEIATATAKAAGLQRAEEKLVRDEDALANYTSELADLEARAGTAPQQGLVHDMARFLSTLDLSGEPQALAAALIESYEAEFGAIGEEGDTQALAKIPAVRQSRDLMRRSVENDQRDIADAKAAAALLATLDAAEPLDEAAVTEAKAQVTTAEKELAAARAALVALQAQDKAAKERESKTAKAKELHMDIVGWLKVAEQFAPDGIPSQILAKAMEPINNRLRDAAIATNWRQVTIRPDMEITAGGRLYSLHSESERWMIDAHIAAVISQIAGLNLIVLDRFDVLDAQHRPELIYWLSDLGDQNMQSLVFGTLKEPPKGLPDNVAAIWIDGGENEQHALLAA